MLAELKRVKKQPVLAITLGKKFIKAAIIECHKIFEVEIISSSPEEDFGVVTQMKMSTFIL